MAYMSQENKATKAPVIKEILKRYGVKGSLSVNHRSTLVLTIKSSHLDLIGNAKRIAEVRDICKPEHMKQHIGASMTVNPHWFREHFDGQPLEFLTEVLAAMNVGNHDRSDIQTDYFDVGWYVEVNIGQWDRPYVLEGAQS
jgi:hypothetical protein